MPKLKDKVVLITGASSGIGRAFAIRCAPDGAKIVLAARRKEELDKVAEEVKAKGGIPLVVPTDVTDAKAVKALFDKTIKQFQVINIVFNNAGLGFVKPFWETSDEQLALQVNVNLLGQMYVSKYAAAIMVKQKSGHIIHTSSLAGLITVPHWAAYCATKWGITALADTLRMELDDYGVKVTSLHPGLVKTGFFGKGKAEVDLAGQQALSSEEVAEAVYAAVFTDKHRIVIPFMSQSFSFLYKFMPSLTEALLESMTKDAEEEDKKSEELPVKAAPVPSYVTKAKNS